MVDALKRASAKRITVVAPFYPYARQDKKHRGREPISARLIADLYRTAGANRLMSVDLHAAQIQGFFDGPVDHLWALPVLSDYVAAQVRHRRDDGGLAGRRPGPAGRHVDRPAGPPLAIIHKRRDPNVANTVAVHEVVGEVAGPGLPAGRRHDRHRRDDLSGGRGTDEPGAPRRSSRPPPTRSCPARRSSG